MTHYEDHPPIPHSLVVAQSGLVALEYHPVGSGAGWVERRPLIAWGLNELEYPRPIPAGPARMHVHAVQLDDGRVVGADRIYDTYAEWLSEMKDQFRKMLEQDTG